MSTSKTAAVATAAIKDALKRIESLASQAQLSAYRAEEILADLDELDELRAMIGDLVTWMEEPAAPELTDVAEAAQ